MIKLKELILEGTIYENLIDLFESPQKIASWDFSELNSMGHNIIVLNKIKDFVPEPTDKFGDYSIYYYEVGGVQVSVFTRDNQSIKAFFEYKIKDDIFYTSRVWQDAICIGLCRELLLDYFLPKFKGVTSGSQQTELGQTYWKKLVDTSLDRKYSVFVINPRNEKIKQITSSEELKNYYSESHFYADFRFLIEK